MTKEETVRLFYQYVRLAVIDSLTEIRKWENEGKFFLKHIGFPEIYYLKNGLPWFNKKSGISDDSPIDYNYLYSAESKKLIPPPQSWNDLWDFVKNNTRLKSYFEVDHFEKLNKEKEESSSMILITAQLKKLVDHYIHSTSTKYFIKRKFIPHFNKWANACFNTKLLVDIVIPILILDFDITNLYTLDDFVHIEKMSEKLHLTRAPIFDSTISINKDLSSASTHAIVFSNWEFQNQTYRSRNLSTSSLDSLAPIIPQINHFFSALRIVTGHKTGYAQIITRPVKWCDNWSANIEEYPSTTIRAYGEAMEQNWYPIDRAIVTEDQVKEIIRVFKGLVGSKSNRLNVASNRLNAAYLRKEETDSIIDICVGLEALFVGNDRGEITHKLASRIGALWSRNPGINLSPFEAFNAVKKIYDYRSVVVHGSKKVSKKRLIKARSGKEIETVNFGLDILRHAILVMVQNQKYLEDGVLDKLLFEDAKNAS